MHGNGTFAWPDKREYKGEFKNNKLNGIGIFEWPVNILIRRFFNEIYHLLII